MNQIVSLFMFSCGDYEKVKQDVWEENWKAMRLYSVVALVAFGVITLVSVFSLSIGKYKWVYLVYTFLSSVYFCISRCQLRSFLGKELVVYSFFAALLLFGIITGTLITPEELTVNYIVFMMVAPLLFTARTAVINGLILSSMLLYIGLAFFAQHNPILSKNLVDVILYGVLSMLLTATMMRSKLQRILYHKEKEMLEVSKRESQERILNYERFLTDMVRYAASEETPDKVLNQLVEYIGQRMTADRAYIFEQNDRGTFDNTYEWCKAGVSKEKDNLQDVPYEGIIETWFAQYQESNNVIIHDIEECKKTSEAIYERLKPQGVNTLVTGPIKINGKMVGFYGVDNPPEEKLHEISSEIDMIEFMISFMIRLRNNADVLEHSALYDQLTDCKNRKALDWAYTEKLEKKQKASSTTLIKAILIILTVLSVVLIFMIPFGIIGPVIMIALDVFLFRSMDVEYEYLFVNGSLDIDKIMAKSRRKNMFSMEMTDLEMMAPSGSPELRPYQGLKGTDYSSGMPGADTYELIVVNNGEKKKIIFEPNKTVCEGLKMLAPRKVFCK